MAISARLSPFCIAVAYLKNLWRRPKAGLSVPCSPATEPGYSLPPTLGLFLIGHLDSDTQMSGTFVTQALHLFPGSLQIRVA